jgi:phosphinothricin acetyltransferase
MLLRPFRPEDLDAVFAIYDDEVLHGTATFDTEPSTNESRQRWCLHHQGPRHPVIVAEDGGVVVGWASLSPYSDRCAYARAAEVSVYVHRDHRGQGVGRALMTELIRAARSAGLGVALARITSESAASIALHRSLGFQRIGTMRRVGEKFGRILDVELLDLHLD